MWRGRRNISGRDQSSGRRPQRKPEQASDDSAGRRIDQVHVIDIGMQTHFGACIAGTVWLDTAAELGPVDGEEDHRLHAHRLDDIQSNFEIAPIGAAVVARLSDVLGPKTEDQILTDDGAVAGLAVRWNGQRDGGRNAYSQT